MSDRFGQSSYLHACQRHSQLMFVCCRRRKAVVPSALPLRLPPGFGAAPLPYQARGCPLRGNKPPVNGGVPVAPTVTVRRTARRGAKPGPLCRLSPTGGSLQKMHPVSYSCSLHFVYSVAVKYNTAPFCCQSIFYFFPFCKNCV